MGVRGRNKGGEEVARDPVARWRTSFEEEGGRWLPLYRPVKRRQQQQIRSLGGGHTLRRCRHPPLTPLNSNGVSVVSDQTRTAYPYTLADPQISDGSDVPAAPVRVRFTVRVQVSCPRS